MAYNPAESLREKYKHYVAEDKAVDVLGSVHKGRAAFVAEFAADLGIRRDPVEGTKHLVDTLENGKPRLRPEQCSLQELAVAICGENWVRSLHGPDDFGGVMTAEDGSPSAITPGNFPNVTAYIGAVTGLLDAKILEAYQKPEYVAGRLTKTLNSKLRQEKLIGAGRIGNVAKLRKPGEPHARAQFGERYVTMPETNNYGSAIDVTTEAVFFDLTNQVLQRAESLGDEMALHKELSVLGVFSGATNPYVYNGTAYNTYLTSGNWINDVVNVFTDHTDLNVDRALFSRMTDQETGNRIVVNPNLIVVSPAKYESAMQVVTARTYEQRTNSSAEIRTGANREAGRYEVLQSPYLDQLLTTATTAAQPGLGLAQSVADDYWWMLDAMKAFVWVQNWDITTKKASPSDYEMLDRGLVMSVFTNYMGVAGVNEPRQVVRNKPS